MNRTEASGGAARLRAASGILGVLLLGANAFGAAEGPAGRWADHTPEFRHILWTTEPKVFTLRYTGAVPPATNVVYTVTDLWERNVWRGTASLRGNGWARIRLDPPGDTGLRAVGWYRLAVEAAGTAALDIDFAVVPPHSPMDPEASFFGIAGSFGGYRNAGPWLNAVTVIPAARLGARWVRITSGWSDLQEAPDAPVDWAFYEQAVAAAEAHGMRVFPMMGTTPAFAVDPAIARPRTHRGDLLRRISMPPREDAWRAFLGEAVQRFGGRVPYWEIWNEPNGAGHWPGGDPERFARFFNLSGRIIRAADPGARIVMGGTTGVKPDWITAFLDAGADPDYLDVVAVHPYRHPDAIPERGFSEAPRGYGHAPLLEDLRGVSELTARLPPLPGGRRRQLWCTESGYNTGGAMAAALHAPVSPRQQAQMLVRTMCLARAAGVDRFFWFRLCDTYGGGLGLLGNADRRFMPKPAYVAYAVLERMTGAASACRLLAGQPEGVFVVRCDLPDGPVWVAWALQPDTAWTPPAVLGPAPRVTDMMGGAAAQIGSATPPALRLAPDPVYVTASAAR
ncbi:MAG: hypothetical protein JW951_10005 [Lentisphaerae bacterium]|nr:hypothetical protein [Lentisphaerota bacterium]